MLGASALALARIARSVGFGGQRLEVRSVNIQLTGLHSDLVGFQMAQVSDLHVGEGYWEPPRAAEAARFLREIQPDLVINTGDFVQGFPPTGHVARIVGPLVLPKSPDSGERNAAVLGNHDYHAGEEAAEQLRRSLRDMGICVLENRLIRVGRGDAEVTVAGLTWSQPGWDFAVEQLAVAARPRIVLVHEPDAAERLPFGIADLVLCGHTHGGQVVLPTLENRITWRFARSRYVAGMYTVNGNLVYVNRGLGMTGVPLRFGARPELTLFRLVR